MITRRRAAKRKPRRHPDAGTNSSPLATAPALARTSRDSEQELLAAYQDQICELEGTVTRLRERVGGLTTALHEARESGAHFVELFENTPTGYLVHDAAGYISATNRVAATLLGLKPSHDCHVPLVQFIAKEDIPLWLAHIRRSALTCQRTSTQLNLCSREGRRTPVQMLTQPGPALGGDKPAHFHTVLLDITQRLATEAALAQTQQNYHRLINTVEGIVWEADARTLDFTFVSRYAERLLGYPLSEWSRPGFWENRIYVEDRERVTHQIARAVARREDLRLDYRVLTAQRQLIWLHDTITLVQRGDRLKLLGVAVDVTERRKAEEELRRAHDLLEQRVAERTAQLRETVGELEAFSYSVSHDLRSPLRMMGGFALLTLEEAGAELSPRIRDYLQRILTGAKRADQLVQDILTYSRVSRANLRLVPVDLEKLLRELIEQHPPFQPPQTEIEVQNPLLPVVGHEPSLLQCLTNLLSNAAKFVRPDTVPRIKIWTELIDSGKSIVDRPTPSGYKPSTINHQLVRLWLEDNGIGIEPANLGRIFNIFERVHSKQQYEGTGIGLAIVRKAVERMGGSVGVESTPGAGSRFWIQLKAAEQI